MNVDKLRAAVNRVVETAKFRDETGLREEHENAVAVLRRRVELLEHPPCEYCEGAGYVMNDGDKIIPSHHRDCLSRRCAWCDKNALTYICDGCLKTFPVRTIVNPTRIRCQFCGSRKVRQEILRYDGDHQADGSRMHRSRPRNQEGHV